MKFQVFIKNCISLLFIFIFPLGAFAELSSIECTLENDRILSFYFSDNSVLVSDVKITRKKSQPLVYLKNEISIFLIDENNLKMKTSLKNSPFKEFDLEANLQTFKGEEVYFGTMFFGPQPKVDVVSDKKTSSTILCKVTRYKPSTNKSNIKKNFDYSGLYKSVSDLVMENVEYSGIKKDPLTEDDFEFQKSYNQEKIILNLHLSFSNPHKSCQVNFMIQELWGPKWEHEEHYPLYYNVFATTPIEPSIGGETGCHKTVEFEWAPAWDISNANFGDVKRMMTRITTLDNKHPNELQKISKFEISADATYIKPDVFPFIPQFKYEKVNIKKVK